MGNSQPVKSNSNANVEVPDESEIADGTLSLVEGRMDRMDVERKSLRKRINMLHAEELEFERRADEVISAYGNNVRVIMLIHGLGSIFLQLNYPNARAWVSVLMVVSFFTPLVVTFIVTYNQIERMSQFEKKLQRTWGELRNELTDLGAKIERTEKELNYLAIKGALVGVLDKMGSLNRHVTAMQGTVTGILELWSISETNRIKSLFQVSIVAIVYGLCFPTMAYYFLNFVGFRRAGTHQLDAEVMKEKLVL